MCTAVHIGYAHAGDPTENRRAAAAERGGDPAADPGPGAAALRAARVPGDHGQGPWRTRPGCPEPHHALLRGQGGAVPRRDAHRDAARPGLHRSPRSLGARLAASIVRRWSGIDGEDPLLVLQRASGEKPEAAEALARFLDAQSLEPLAPACAARPGRRRSPRPGRRDRRVRAWRVHAPARPAPGSRRSWRPAGLAGRDDPAPGGCLGWAMGKLRVLFIGGTGVISSACVREASRAATSSCSCLTGGSQPPGRFRPG